MNKQKVKELANELSRELELLIQRVNLLSMKDAVMQFNPNWKNECVDVLLSSYQNNFDSGHKHVSFSSNQNTLDSNFVEVGVLDWISETRNLLQVYMQGLNELFQQHVWENNDSKSDLIKQLTVKLNNFGFYPGIEESLELRTDVFDLWLDTVHAVLRYEEFYRLREQFQYVMFLVFSSQKVDAKNQGELEYLRKLSRIYSDKHLHQLKYEINDEDILTVSLDEFSQAINNKNITRLRVCKICGNVFWAERITAKCCSEKCLNLYHVRKSSLKRKTDPNYVWEQDMKGRANIRAKKEIKKIGYTNLETEKYKKNKRKHPHRVIYDYLVTECFRTNKSPERINIPKDVFQPLLDFLLKIQNNKVK